MTTYAYPSLEELFHKLTYVNSVYSSKKKEEWFSKFSKLKVKYGGETHFVNLTYSPKSQDVTLNLIVDYFNCSMRFTKLENNTRRVAIFSYYHGYQMGYEEEYFKPRGHRTTIVSWLLLNITKHLTFYKTGSLHGQEQVKQID